MTAMLDLPAATTIASLDALDLPDHPDLLIGSTTGEQWLYLEAGDGAPADFVIDWREAVTDADGETSHEHRTEFGTLEHLDETLADVLDNPARSADSIVTLDVSAWALRYKAVRA